MHCYSGLSPRVRTLSSILPPGSRAEGWPWAVVSLGVSVTKSTPAREPLALRWPLPEPPLVPPALCKPRRQRKQRASAAPGAAAAGCQLDARKSPRAWRATSPAGLGAPRRGRPRDAPWRAREHTRACLCALACTSVRSPPPTTWSAPEAKAFIICPSRARQPFWMEPSFMSLLWGQSTRRGMPRQRPPSPEPQRG